MDDAEFEQKRLCRRHRRAALRCCIPAVLLAGVTVAEECFALPEMWTQGAYLRFGVVGGLLLVQALLALPLWRDMIENLQKKRFTCAWGALLLTLACLGDCAWCLLRGGAHLPLAGAAALVVFFCQWGVYLRCAARRERRAVGTPFRTSIPVTLKQTGFPTRVMTAISLYTSPGRQ